ncbi:hypothetical protein [Alcanivorax sp. S71-1-4]|uniref:hypothetical protein n=1 Tax=Alcanivorax sp. S71-1-4 TaxID=1177159 RepID=UPI0013588A97|nr:hypothetical protein [Alcanivorax sp. S71-1-4]
MVDATGGMAREGKRDIIAVEMAGVLERLCGYLRICLRKMAFRMWRSPLALRSIASVSLCYLDGGWVSGRKPYVLPVEAQNAAVYLFIRWIVLKMKVLFEERSVFIENSAPILAAGFYDDRILCINEAGVIYELDKIDDRFLDAKEIVRLGSEAVFGIFLSEKYVALGNKIWSLDGGIIHELPCAEPAMSYRWAAHGDLVFASSVTNGFDNTYVFKSSNDDVEFFENIGGKRVLPVAGNFLFWFKGNGDVAVCSYSDGLFVLDQIEIPAYSAIESIGEDLYIVARDGRLLKWSNGNLSCICFEDGRIKGWMVRKMAMISSSQAVILFSSDDSPRRKVLAKVDLTKLEVIWVRDPGFSYDERADIIASGGFIFSNVDSYFVAIDVDGSDVLWKSKVRSTLSNRFVDLENNKLISYADAYGMIATLIEW